MVLSGFVFMWHFVFLSFCLFYFVIFFVFSFYLFFFVFHIGFNAVAVGEIEYGDPLWVQLSDIESTTATFKFTSAYFCPFQLPIPVEARNKKICQ